YIAHAHVYRSDYGVNTPGAPNMDDRRAIITEYLDYALSKPEVRMRPSRDLMNWMQNPVRLGANIPSSAKLVQKTTNHFLDLASDTQRNGNVNAEAPSTADDHLWSQVSDGAGFFFLQNKKSGMFANVSGGATFDGANVAQWDTTTGDHFKVQFIDQGN